LIGSGCEKVKYRTKEAIENYKTDILEDSFHQGDSNFGLLNEVVLRILDLKTSMFLPCWTSILEPYRIA